VQLLVLLVFLLVKIVLTPLSVQVVYLVIFMMESILVKLVPPGSLIVMYAVLIITVLLVLMDTIIPRLLLVPCVATHA